MTWFKYDIIIYLCLIYIYNKALQSSTSPVKLPTSKSFTLQYDNKQDTLIKIPNSVQYTPPHFLEVHRSSWNTTTCPVGKQC